MSWDDNRPSTGPHEIGLIAYSSSLVLHLVAFDLLAGTEVGLSDGPLADAVLAAAAIPRVLPPVRWCGRLLAADAVPHWLRRSCWRPG